MEFIPFPKIPRLKRGCIITEKVDGTNAQVTVWPLLNLSLDQDVPASATAVATHEGQSYAIFAGSRNRWITPEKDNFGFASWVKQNADELVKLGEGSHFGEWWGLGIQRGYGLHERRFSLFNTGRWSDAAVRPACCGVVPVLYAGDFTTDTVDEVMDVLKGAGSVAVPGFMKPEGLVVFMTAARHLYKVLAENDELPKGMQEAA
jgi:hypothetical protein